VNGGTTIGSNSFVGSGAVIREGINLESNSFIPMGSLVFKNSTKKDMDDFDV
jgi:acetyltransferase-like isoleucine patch superfamily enzyme